MQAVEHQTRSPIDHRRAEIENRLMAIAADHQVRILYACESGSRAWGFASPDSDFDVRFLYVHPLPWYLRIHPGRDVIEHPITDDLDINGWELRKALQLLAKGNATLLEWLGSPIVYQSDDRFLAQLRSVANDCYQPQRAFHHYLHMAEGNHRAYFVRGPVRLKKYLYVLRPLLAALWIEQNRGLAPMRFETLVDALVDEPKLRETIDELLAMKRATGEAETIDQLPIAHAFIDRELKRLKELPPLPRKTIDMASLDRLLLETVQRFSC